MKRIRHPQDRRGVVMALFAISIVALVGFLALSIDLGMITVARTQLQDAADASAMAGARTLDGITANGSNNNYSNVTPNATSALVANTVLGTALTSGDMSLQIGKFVYSTSNTRFEGQIPGPSSGNWSLVRATVSKNINSRLTFAKIFSFTGGNIVAISTAVHRPRDIAIVLDYSGSMRFASLMGLDSSTSSRTSNNGDSLVPTWGHYSSSNDNLQATSFSPPYDAANISATTSDGRAPVIQDFYLDNSGGAAFSQTSAGYATTPGGDVPLTNVKTVYDIVNKTTIDSHFEDTNPANQRGYAYFTGKPFNGHTVGPGYWGKTFFMWPPDPFYDWRNKYFTPLHANPSEVQNTDLWTNNGYWKAPTSSTYKPNYDAILYWLKNTGPNPFPSRLQSGRIVYYTSIPDTINTASWPPADLNQRFWKDYIDWCLGLVQTGSNSWLVLNDGDTGIAGYGTDFAWGTVQIKAKPTGTGQPYMDYKDNPLRPKLHFWFGPLSMIDFLGCYNVWSSLNPDSSRFCWWPGTCHESPLYACKLGIRAGLSDIQNNHPNDQVALAMFSVPKSSVSDTNATRFNRVRVPLSQDYPSMQDSLWYPPATIYGGVSTVTPYDSDNLEVPRAMGGTCYAMPLMLAYNQFSANNSLLTFNPGGPSGDAGGNGRKGAQKIIIFETDGAPNTTASATLSNNGAYQSYYRVRYNSSSPGGSDFPTGISGYSDNASTVTNQINTVCNQICALDTASPPGYSTNSKKVLIHCLGFGPAFAPGSSTRTANLTTLKAMQVIGNVTDGMPAYKVIYGTEAVVADNLQKAFTQILQSGVQVALIQ